LQVFYKFNLDRLLVVYSMWFGKPKEVSISFRKVDKACKIKKELKDATHTTITLRTIESNNGDNINSDRQLSHRY
jgi:hypothetical protein